MTTPEYRPSDRLIPLGSKAKVMSGLFGIRETVTAVPSHFRVQLLDPLLRDTNRGFGERNDADEDAGRPVSHYNHADHRQSRQFDVLDADGNVVCRDAGDLDDASGYDRDDGDGGSPAERVPLQDSLLLLNGVDTEGRTVCVRVTGMRYSLYVLCPESWSAINMKALATAFEVFYRLPPGHVECRQRWLRHMIGWQPDPRDLRQTRRYNYCLLGFGSSTVMGWAAKAIQSRKLRPREFLSAGDLGQLQIYESRVDPVHKALERMRIKPCSWFDVTQWRVPDEYYTHAQIEVEAPASAIIRQNKCDTMAPMWKASWDVECYSADDSFPRADHPKNCDHTICINTYFRQHRADGSIGRVIQTSHHFGPVHVDRPVDRVADRVSDLRSCGEWGVLNVEAAGESAAAQVEGADRVYVMTCDTELEAIEGWRDLIVLDIQPTVVEGYNTDGFDFGWIGVRAEMCAGYGVRSRLFESGVMIGEHTPMRRKDLDSAAKGSNTLNFIPMPGRILIDMYHIVKAEKRLESYTLDDVCKVLFPKDESLRKIDVPPEQIFRKYRSGDVRERAVIVDYCARDCRLPMALEELLLTLTSVVEMAKITRTPLPLMLISGQQIKTWNQILFAAHKMGYVVNIVENLSGSASSTADWLRGLYGVGKGGGVATEWLPGVIAMASMRIGNGNADGHNDPSGIQTKATALTRGNNGQPSGTAAAADEGYEGATVLSPKSGYYDVPIVTLDYNSLYPSIMEANNLCPSTRVIDARVMWLLRQACREVNEPINEIRAADGMATITTTTASGPAGQAAVVLNRVFASRPDWKAGQFGDAVAYRQVSPASRTHIFVQHVIGVIPCILTKLKQFRKAVRDRQKAYPKGSVMYDVLDTRQLGIKITANCFPADDHEILTEMGFLNYAGVLRHFERHARLSVACYVDGQLEYHNVTRANVIASAGDHRLVRFEAAPDAGSDRAIGNGVSLCCTDNHRIYARVGPAKTAQEWRHHDDKRPPQGTAAHPFTIQSAGAILDAGARDPSTVVQFAAACSKGVALDGGELPFVAALGFDSEDQVDAFVQLYGYWLGSDGWLDATRQAVVFSSKSAAHSTFVAGLFARLSLPVQTEDAGDASIDPEPSAGAQHAHCTTRRVWRHHSVSVPSWWRYFVEQNDAKGPKESGGAVARDDRQTAHEAGNASGGGAKQMGSWVWRRLHRDRLALFFRGLSVASGDDDGDDRGAGTIYTLSRDFAEKLIHLALHAGYSAVIRPRRATDHGNETTHGWDIDYSNRTKETRPEIAVASETSSTPYHGTVWCINVPVKPHLIIARRITTHNGLSIPSRALVVGNSVYGFLGAVKRGRMPCVEVSESVTCIGRDMIMATKAYVETHMARYIAARLALLKRPSITDTTASDAERLKGTQDRLDDADRACAQSQQRLDVALASAGLANARIALPSVGIDPTPVTNTVIERQGEEEEEEATVDDRTLKKARKLYDAFQAANVDPTRVNSASVVYGDSVSGDTPLLVRDASGRIDYVRADQFVPLLCPTAPSNGTQKHAYTEQTRWSPYQDDKESVPLADGTVDVWTERGWTPVRRIIRHRTAKRMYRVCTPTACVDVTEDHSLLDRYGQKVRPTQVGPGSRLLHAALPATDSKAPTASFAQHESPTVKTAWASGVFFASGHADLADRSWRIDHKDADLLTRTQTILAARFPQLSLRVDSQSLVFDRASQANDSVTRDFDALYCQPFYAGDKQEKRIPRSILNAPAAIKEAFLCGFNEATGANADDGGKREYVVGDKAAAAGLFYLLDACRRHVRIRIGDSPLSAVYRLVASERASLPMRDGEGDEKEEEKDEDQRTTSIAPLGPCDAYVYDLETANHHFAAGVGRMVVHNTDSVMIHFHGVPKSRAGVDLALQLGVAASDYITSKFPDQIILETEKAYWPYVLFRKKRYVGRLWTLEGKPPYIDAKGVEVKRRDNWAGMRKTYKKCLDSMMMTDDGDDRENDNSNSNGEDMSLEPARGAASMARGIDAVTDIVLRLIDDLKHNRVPLDDYKISKSLKRDYSKCKSPPPHVVVRDKIRGRGGAEPLAGNRVYFVITIDPRTDKVSPRAEDPTYVASNPHLVRVDRLYYLRSLMKPFGALLEPCFENPEVLFERAAVEISNQQRGQRPIIEWIGRRTRSPIPTSPVAPAITDGAHSSPSSPHRDDGTARACINENGKRPLDAHVSPKDADAAERAKVASLVKRRQMGQGYTPAGVLKQEQAKARKARKAAGPPKTGPISPFLRAATRKPPPT